MDPAQLQAILDALAQIFGVEANPEAVMDALGRFMALLSEGAAPEEMPEGAAGELEGYASSDANPAPVFSFDPAKLRGALGLKSEATNIEVIGALFPMFKALKMAIGANDPVTVNTTALQTAFQAFKSAGSRYIPFATGDNTGASDTGNGSGQQARGGKSERRPGSQDRRGNHRVKPVGGPIMEFLSNIRAGKAQSYQIGPTGGYIMRTEIATEFVPALRDALPLYEMGVDIYDMDGIEAFLIPKDEDFAEAYWVGEGATVLEGGDKTKGVMLYPKPLAAQIKVPNKYFANSIVNYEEKIKEKIIYRMQRAIMRAALFGSGGVEGSNVGIQPVGMLNRAGITKTPIGAPDGRTPTMDDLSEMMGRIEDTNVDLDETTYWLFSPRTKRSFTTIADDNGQPLLRQRWNDGEEPDILGYDYKTTNIIPNNVTYGANADTSYIFAGVFRWLAMGLSNQFEFIVDPYTMSGQLQTVITGYTYADVAFLRDQAFQVLTGVRR